MMLMSKKEFDELPEWTYTPPPEAEVYVARDNALPEAIDPKRWECLPEAVIGAKWKYCRLSEYGDVWWIGQYIPYEGKGGIQLRWMMVAIEAE
jgi:hypothetical protein